MFTDRPF
jgi:hypothetical protein